MKWLLWIIVAMAGLVAVVTGCDGMHRYDGRLEAADSLMHDDADSALALVEAIDAGSLTTDGDRAYRDLLLTQARYRCYIPATSDSAINRALAYYRAHAGEREKLTRCYLYKGAVMEELGQVDSAMFHYKTAEVTAAPDDYFNLGQINTRIADLYRLYYGDEETCFEKYKQALHFHRLTGNKPQQQNCLFNMANCASDSSIQRYEDYCKQAYDLALELNDSACIYKCLEFQCRHLYSNDSNNLKAKDMALDCLNNYNTFVTEDLLIDLSFIYMELNRLDSAHFYIDALNPKSMIEPTKMRYYWALSAMFEKQGDTAKSNYYSALKSQISDSIDDNKEKNIIQQIEISHNQIQKGQWQRELFSTKSFLWFPIVTAVVLVIVLMVYHYLKIHRYQLIIKALKNIENQHLNDHHELLEQIEVRNSVIGHFIQNLVEFMQASIEISEKDTPKVIKGKIRDYVGSVMTDDFWLELRGYLDKNNNNLISHIAKNPSISDIDLKFIELCCCNFNYIEIAVALGLSPNYISTKRKSIARKLGIKIPLQDYLNNYMSSNKSEGS